MILRSILCLGCLWLLLVNVSTITTTISQGTANELVAGASWSYRLITRSELRTSGEYEGTYLDRSIVEGRNIIKEITAYNIEIEESWSWNSTQKGTGHYESSSGSELITGFSTYTIDRNTLTYTSYKTSNGTYEQDIDSYIGLPVVEFISTSLQSGQNVAYNVLGRRENCSVTYNVINFQGASLPVITLHYSGIGGLDAWLATEGTGESTFNFDKSSGLLVSYSARYSASSKGRTEGTRTNTQEYVVYEISASPPDYTPIIIVAILTIIGIIIFAYVSKRLKTETVTGSGVAYASEFVSDDIPSSMVAGQQYTVHVTFRNTGGNTWTSAGNYELGSPGDSYPFCYPRATMDASSVDNGQSYTFTFTMTAPSAGSYVKDWRMLREGVTWFGATQSKTVTVIGS